MVPTASRSVIDCCGRISAEPHNWARYHKVQCRSLVEINPPSPWTTPSSQPCSARLFPTSLCWTRLLHCRPGLTPCLAASRSMLRTRLSSSSATSATSRQITECGSPPPRSTTKVFDASFRIRDRFRYSGKTSLAGKTFLPMRRISRRRCCARASSLSPGILESARCQGRGGLQDQVPRRHRNPRNERRHLREPPRVVSRRTIRRVNGLRKWCQPSGGSPNSTLSTCRFLAIQEPSRGGWDRNGDPG